VTHLTSIKEVVQAILFNIVLREAVKYKIITGSIINKSWQICAYADDFVIIAKSDGAMRQTYCNIEIMRRTIGFKINEEETKSMKLYTMEVCRKVQIITIGEHSFNGVKDFVHLGFSLSNSYNMSKKKKIKR